MRFTQDAYFTVLTSFVLFTVASAHAADTTYVLTPGEGNPYGFSGTVVLDTSSSRDGSTADVVSLTLSGETGSVTGSLALAPGNVGMLEPDATQIMRLALHDASFSEQAGAAAAEVVQATPLDPPATDLTDVPDTGAGSPLAEPETRTPDTCATLSILLFSSAVLCLFSRLQRRDHGTSS